MHSTEPTLWIAVGMCSLALLLLAERASFRPLIAVSKISASTSFLGLAVSLGALATPSGQLFMVGLTLCWLGDALLLPPGQTIWFELGIASFLLGHVAYAICFFTLGIDVLASLAGAVPVVLAGGLAHRWLAPHVPPAFRMAVTCYSVTIGTMVVLAIGASTGNADASPLVFLGAAAFAISDVSVARERFVQSSYLNSLWGLPLYYLAQGMLAAGLAGSSASS